MNTPTPPPLPNPQPSSMHPALHRWALEPIENPIGFGTVIDHLLKQPGRIVHSFIHDRKGVASILAFCSVVSFALFGLLLGTFSGGEQLWAAPLKVTGGMVVAVLICLPSLYIFSALGGMTSSLLYIIRIVLAALAVCGLLLLGFAPVWWVFAQSTESGSFVGFLALAVWLISLALGLRMLRTATLVRGMQSPAYLQIWMVLFVVVTLQMSTSLRPIIGNASSLLPTQKRFFFEHWIAEINSSDVRPDANKAPSTN